MSLDARLTFLSKNRGFWVSPDSGPRRLYKRFVSFEHLSEVDDSSRRGGLGVGFDGWGFEEEGVDNWDLKEEGDFVEEDEVIEGGGREVMLLNWKRADYEVGESIWIEEERKEGENEKRIMKLRKSSGLRFM